MAVFQAPLLLTLVIAFSAVICSSGQSDASVDNENPESSSPKTQVKRNVAWIARSGHRKFFFPERLQRRNMAWFARSGGKDSSYLPSKRTMDLDDPEHISFDPYQDDIIDYTDEDPYYVDKRNIGSLVKSKNVPSFISGYKRHIGSAVRYMDEDPSIYGSPQKRFFASLLKSASPPPSIYSRMNRRMNYYQSPPTKKFFSTLLENDYEVPGEDVEKRHFSSMLDSEDPYEGKRSFNSLLKSDSGIGMAGKRYYSSLLDNTKDEEKRYMASLLKSSALDDVDKSPTNQILGSIYDRQNELVKRTFSSLLNRKNPYQTEKHITKRHIGSLRDTSKRFYGSLLDNTPSNEGNDKRSFNSILKSSSYQQPDKKHVAAAMRYRPGKRDPDSQMIPTEEELELDELQKRFVGSILDDTPEKRHFASLLDNRDTRGGYLYDGEHYPILNQEEKRYIASLLDNRPAEQKRFLGSLMDSDTPPYAAVNNFDKRYIGSTISSRMRYKNQGKRFLGSAINSRMKYLNSDPEEDKRFVGSIVQSRQNNKGIQEGKRFYASVLDNSRAPGEPKDGEEKRFVGSALKSKVSSSKNDLRGKREAEDEQVQHDRSKRSVGLDEGEPKVPWSEGGEDLPEGPVDDLEQSGDLVMSPVKRILPRIARQSWFPEFY